MIAYKHTQISYILLVITLIVFIFFAWAYNTARSEPPSYYSGTNFAVTAVMILIVAVLASCTTLTTIVDQNYLRIRFGYGTFQKKFLIKDIVSVKSVKNHWYYGWGIRVWFWPYMWIYSISGFKAVEIVMRSGKIYRVGTDDSIGLEGAIKRVGSVRIE